MGPQESKKKTARDRDPRTVNKQPGMGTSGPVKKTDREGTQGPRKGRAVPTAGMKEKCMERVSTTDTQNLCTGTDGIRRRNRLQPLGPGRHPSRKRINSLRNALEMKARSPEKFMDLSDVKVTDEDGFLSRNNTIKANNKIVKERIWTGLVTSKIETQPLGTDTDAQLHDERIITVREEPSLHVESIGRLCECTGQ